MLPVSIFIITNKTPTVLERQFATQSLHVFADVIDPDQIVTLASPIRRHSTDHIGPIKQTILAMPDRTNMNFLDRLNHISIIAWAWRYFKGIKF
jgi:hypothetical protein